MGLINKLYDVFKTKRINIFLIFLLLSFSFLMLTKLSKNYTQTLTFNINKTNVPEEVIIVNDTTYKFDITLRTYGFKLLSYIFYKPKIKVNISNLDKDSKNYVWTNKNKAEIIKQFDTDLEIQSINPDTLFFRYDKNYVKKVPINLKHDIKFKPGYDALQKLQSKPDSVRVIGPKVLLDSIQFIETELLQLKDISQNIKTNIKLKPVTNNEQVTYSNKTVYVEAEVAKFTEGEVEIPVNIVNIPDDISLSFYPKNVKVYFYTSLENYRKINKSDFTIECDFKSVSGTKNYLVPKVKLKPKSVKNIRLNTNKIDFIIKQ